MAYDGSLCIRREETEKRQLNHGFQQSYPDAILHVRFIRDQPMRQDLQRIPSPGGYHHDEFEMEDGNLLSLTDDLTSETVEDMCVLIDRNTGEILKTWDYKKFLDPKTVSSPEAGLPMTGSTTMPYGTTKNTNSLTFSGRHIDSMVNIDFETGDLNWIIGDRTRMAARDGGSTSSNQSATTSSGSMSSTPA